MSIGLNKLDFLCSGQALNKRLALEGRTATGLLFAIDECDRQAAAGVLGTSAVVVFGDSFVCVAGNACVQTLVRAFDNIDKPTSVFFCGHVYFLQVSRC